MLFRHTNMFYHTPSTSAILVYQHNHKKANQTTFLLIKHKMITIKPLLLIVAVLLLVVTTSSSSLFVSCSQKHQKRKNWKKLASKSVLDTDTIDFKLFLQLNKENDAFVKSDSGNNIHIDELRDRAKIFQQQQHSSSPISERLELWRSLLSPSQESINNAKQSLAKYSLAPYCGDLLFDHFSCENVPHSIAKKVFQVAFEHVQDELTGMTRLSAIHHPHKQERHFRDVEKSFEFISNIKVHPRFLQRQSRYHVGKLKKDLEEQIVATKSSSNKDKPKKQQEDSSSNPYFHKLYFPLTSPVANEAKPIAVYTSLHDTVTAPNYNPTDNNYGKLSQIIVMPFCADGTLSKLVNQTGSSDKLLTCDTPGVTPVRVSWSINELVTPTSQHYNDAGSAPSVSSTAKNSGSFSVNQPGDCKAASDYGYAASNTVPFCIHNVPLTSQNPLTPGRPFVIRLFATFGNDVETGTTTVSYFNSSYFNPRDSTRFPNWNDDGNNNKNNINDQFYKEHAMFGNSNTVFPGRTYATFLPVKGLFADEIREHYNVPASIPNFDTIDHDHLAQGVIEFPYPSGKPYRQSDVEEYMKYCGSKCSSGYNSRKDLLTYVGANASTSPNGEATMDVELIMGIAPGIKTVFWNYNDSKDAGFGETVANLFHQMMTETGDVSRSILKNSTTNLSSPVSTWSMSWSACEFDDGGSYVNNMRRAETYAAALSSSGITFVASSGDAGTSCDNDDFVPFVGMPVNLPHVVAVGGTTIRDRSSTIPQSIESSSSAMGDWITTGGGFSNVISQPDYQAKMFTATSRQNFTWFQLPSPNQNKPSSDDGLSWTQRNSAGRGLPDLAALGSLISTVSYNGDKLVSGGTSASSPIVAALITLLNNERLNDRLKNNKTKTTTTLQSIHNWLYQNTTTAPRSSSSSSSNSSNEEKTNLTNVGGNASIFFDVTVGDNCYGKASSSVTYPTFPYCYSAREQWDAVSGFGVVKNFSALLDSALRWNPPPPPPPPPPLPLNVVGIIVGCAAMLVFVGGLTVFAWWYQRKKKQQDNIGPADEWYRNVNAAENGSSLGSSNASSLKSYSPFKPQKSSGVDFYAGSV